MRTDRVPSIDRLRGLIMVLMVIDHVRAYAGVPTWADGDYGIFFTRWITHFVAPGFAFFAGAGAFLHGEAIGDRKTLSRFLVTRGLLLVLLELTLVRLLWTFNLRIDRFALAGVIWMLGWCMVLLAPMTRWSPRTVGITGVAIVLAQPLLRPLFAALPAPITFWTGLVTEFVYPAGLQPWPGISVLYHLVPWIGVMAAGYGFGTILLRDGAERRRIAVRLGAAMTAAFLVIGSVLAWQARADDAPPFLFMLLGQNKYPASPLFLAMTLGPLLLLLPAAERMRGRVADALQLLGRVPMWFYLWHILLVHLAGIIVMRLRGTFDSAWYASAPYTDVPGEQRWSLPLLYLVFAIVVALLYPICRWYATAKRERPRAWMRYV